MEIDETTLAKAEAMATIAMSTAFAEFESDYGKAIAKGHKLVAAQAEARLTERWSICLRMALLCVNSTSDAIANFQADRAHTSSGSES